MKRKDFVKGVAARSGLAGFWTGFWAHNPMERLRGRLHSDDTVPTHLDCRTNPDCAAQPLKIFRYGREVEHVTAYHLDEDWVEVVRYNPAGEVVLDSDGFVYDRLAGGVSVQWDREEIRRRRSA